MLPRADRGPALRRLVKVFDSPRERHKIARVAQWQRRRLQNPHRVSSSLTTRTKARVPVGCPM